MRLLALDRLVHPIVLLVAGLLLATPAAAQLLRGTVIDRSSGRRIGGAFISFRASDGKQVGSVVSDSAGQFSIRLTPGARYQADISAPGYRDESDAVQTLRRATASVLLRLRPEPFALEPLRVVVSNEISPLDVTGFYHRRQMGFGYFMTAADIERTDPVVMTDALRNLAGVRIVCDEGRTGGFSRDCDVRTQGATSMFFRGVCRPTVVLDGVVLRVGGVASNDDRPLNDLLNPFDLEAIEVYPSAAGVPVEYGGYMSPCGAVVAWSRK